MLARIKKSIKENRRLFSTSLKLKESRLSPSSENLSAQEKGWYDALLSDGIVAIPNYFTAEDCDEFISEFKRLEPNHGKLFDNDYRIFGAEKHSQIIHDKYAQDPVFRKVGEAAVGDTLVMQTAMAAKLSSAITKIGSGGGWHRDSFSKQFKTLVYLTDVSDENGPFEYVKGSHSLESVNKILFELASDKPANHARYTDAQAEKICEILGKDIARLTATRGTVVMFDPRGLHRGRPIDEGERFAITNYYIAKSYHQKDNIIEQLAY